MRPPEKVTPPPLSGNRIPGPNYQIPPSPPASVGTSTEKPLMIFRINPGVTFEGGLDQKKAMIDQAAQYIG